LPPGPPRSADAAAAGHELADRLPHPAGLTRILSAFVRAALDERLAEEARHLVVRERPRHLERREREGREIERRVLVRIAVEHASERAGAR